MVISAILAIGLILLITGHILKESFPALISPKVKLFDLEGKWRPIHDNPRYSILPALFGTIYVSFLSIVFALILGVGTAMALNFYVPEKIKEKVISLIDLLAGVPSVVFGFIGLTVVVKFFVKYMHMAAGQCILAGSIVLSIMLLPYVVSTCSESIEFHRKKYEKTAYALGLNKEYTMVKIIAPSIIPSIIAATMMAFGRVLGETMAVMMVIGNSPIFPKLLGRGQTIAALTALEMGSVEYNSMHLSVLYSANLILLLVLGTVYGIGYVYSRRLEKNEK